MSTPNPMMRLSNQELDVCRNLLEAFPDYLDRGATIERRNHSASGSPKDAIDIARTQVCRIRALLGQSAIVTVWQTRTRADGSKVELRNRPILGYRAGGALADLIGSQVPSTPPVPPGSSESEPIVGPRTQATPHAPSSLRCPEGLLSPHRGRQETIHLGLEAAARQAVGL